MNESLEPTDILKEIERDIESRKRSFLYSLIRRDQAMLMVEYIKEAERMIRAIHESPVQISSEWESVRKKLGLE